MYEVIMIVGLASNHVQDQHMCQHFRCSYKGLVISCMSYDKRLLPGLVRQTYPQKSKPLDGIRLQHKGVGLE